jgi:hypothetical protein
LEAPILFVALSVMALTLAVKFAVVVAGPKVNGISTLNCPPRLAEALLRNQTLAAALRFSVKAEVLRVKPLLGVN